MCFTVTWSWSLMIDGAMRRKTQSVSQLDVHISLREMQSFAYSPLSGIPDSLRTWIFDPRQVSTSTSWLVVIFYVHMEIVNFVHVSKMVKFAHFGGTPENGRKCTFWGGSKNPPFWRYPICQKPVPGGTIVWWYPPNYLLFRYPVWHPKTLFLVPKHVDPPKPGVLGKPCFWHVFRTFRNLVHFCVIHKMIKNENIWDM